MCRVIPTHRKSKIGNRLRATPKTPKTEAAREIRADFCAYSGNCARRRRERCSAAVWTVGRRHREFTRDSTSSGSGITQSAPRRVVTMAAAAFAKVSIAVRRASSRAASPYFRTKWTAQPPKVSPAPVVSTVPGIRNGGANTDVPR